MPNNKYLVTHQPAGGTEQNITNLIILSETEGIKSTADSFSFSVKNRPKATNTSTGAVTNVVFDDGDRIKIYLWSGGTTPTNPIIDGVVRELKREITMDGDVWNVSGQNSLELLLNAPIPAAYASTDANNTSPEIIKNLIGLARGIAQGVTSYTPQITAELVSIDATNGKIDDTTTNLPSGESIKTIPVEGFYRTDTPVFQLIEELSAPKYTGVSNNIVGNYIFYLDNQNRFHWEPRSNTISGTINVGDYISAVISKTLFDVINFAIIDAGKDFNGRPIKTYVFHPTGIVKGIKGKLFVQHEIASQLKEALSVSPSTPFYNKDQAANTDNGNFRTKVIAAAKAWGLRQLILYGQPRFKLQLIMKGTTGYSKGAYYTIAIPNIFRDDSNSVVGSVKLRLREVSHKFASKSWTTVLNFQQDELVFSGGAVVR